jgi:hypothetical protein
MLLKTLRNEEKHHQEQQMRNFVEMDQSEWKHFFFSAKIYFPLDDWCQQMRIFFFNDHEKH